MPGNAVHYRWWKRLVSIPIGLGLVVFAYTGNFLGGLSVVCGYLFGAYLDPDADQLTITGAEGRVLRKFGIFGILWVMYWFPYSYIMPHRSFLSHFPGVSTIIRDLYLSIPIFVVMWWFEWFPSVAAIDIVLPYMALFLAGQTMSDGLHYLLDMTYRGKE